ncbi:hypothetical protein IAR50_005836 [Cryptococcus sp. DSM 104548]
MPAANRKPRTSQATTDKKLTRPRQIIACLPCRGRRREKCGGHVFSPTPCAPCAKANTPCTWCPTSSSGWIKSTVLPYLERQVLRGSLKPEVLAMPFHMEGEEVVYDRPATFEEMKVPGGLLPEPFPVSGGGSSGSLSEAVLGQVRSTLGSSTSSLEQQQYPIQPPAPSGLQHYHADAHIQHHPAEESHQPLAGQGLPIHLQVSDIPMAMAAGLVQRVYGYHQPPVPAQDHQEYASSVMDGGHTLHQEAYQQQQMPLASSSSALDRMMDPFTFDGGSSDARRVPRSSYHQAMGTGFGGGQQMYQQQPGFESFEYAQSRNGGEAPHIASGVEGPAYHYDDYHDYHNDIIGSFMHAGPSSSQNPASAAFHPMESGAYPPAPAAVYQEDYLNMAPYSVDSSSLPNLSSSSHPEDHASQKQKGFSQEEVERILNFFASNPPENHSQRQMVDNNNLEGYMDPRDLHYSHNSWDPSARVQYSYLPAPNFGFLQDSSHSLVSGPSCCPAEPDFGCFQSC